MAYSQYRGGFDDNNQQYGYEQDGNSMGMGQFNNNARPMVDPEAEGEVDPNLYPQAKEATHKIRGRYDFIEMLCGSVDQEMMIVKAFYFFFYSAFGSLFPLMGVYFKQMGMNPLQCGLLVGSRPFVEFLSAPFWGSYADKSKKGKVLLMASIAAWIIFTLPLGFIQPPAISCIQRYNDTYYELRSPDEAPRLVKRSVDNLQQLIDVIPSELSQSHSRSKRAVKPFQEAGMSPLKIEYVNNFNEKIHKNWVSPLFSSTVYRTDDIHKAFFLLMLLVIIGEFFSAPAITLADSAVITLLGDNADQYGHQRMFGSLGWGVAMFFVGIALDHSTTFPDHPCGPMKQEKNYSICFTTFAVSMTAALIAASQINFKYPEQSDDMEFKTNSQEPAMTKEDEMQNDLATQLGIPSLAGGAGSSSIPAQKQSQPSFGAQTKMFAQRLTTETPQWMLVFANFSKDLKCLSILFVAWFLGFGIGLIFTFLFWHLQDYGGNPTLFGIASVINHLSEIFAYFFSFKLITRIGHVKVLCLGLVGNVIRFLYISMVRNPWWVLPFELMQGITHAACWAACCSYIAHNSPPHLRISSQGVLQGLHHGLGRGCGAVFGGLFVTYFGSKTTFRAYGVVSIGVLAAFVFINFYRKEQGFISDIPTTEDPHQVAEETSHLAPHGVPANPLPRALSSSRLNEVGDPSYGTYSTVGGNLGVPGSNPFANATQDQQNNGYGANY